jgi:hypothetical protein
MQNVRNTKGSGSFERPGSIWQDNIKINLEELEKDIVTFLNVFTC